MNQLIPLLMHTSTFRGTVSVLCSISKFLHYTLCKAEYYVALLLHRHYRHYHHRQKRAQYKKRCVVDETNQTVRL